MTCLAHKTYAAVERLRDGREIAIRALRSDDEPQMLESFSRSSPQSLYRRSFGVKKHLSENEKAFFFNVERDVAEIAFVAIDEFHGKGVGSALMRYLIFLAGKASTARI